MSTFSRSRRTFAAVLAFVAFGFVGVASATSSDTFDLLPLPHRVPAARSSSQQPPHTLLATPLNLANAGTWLIGQQVTSGATAGALPWTPGDASVYGNTQGATAEGLLRLYKLTGSAGLLTAAVANGQCQIHDCITGTYGFTYPGNGTHRFGTHDQLFLIELSQFSGDPQYAQFVTDHFWTPLANSTFGDTGDNYDVVGYANHVVTGRAGQGIPELAAWDISKLVIAAHEAGQSTAEAAFMNGVLASLNAADGTHTTYDVVGLTGAIWASAVSGIALDPTTGTWASDNSTTDLATSLLAHQAPGGGFVGSTASAVTDANADAQTTGYAMLGLSALNRAAYISNIQSAGHFVASLQQPSGEIVSFSGATGTEAGSVETHGEASEAYADTIAGVDRWVAPTGADSGDCSIQASPCQTITYAISQAGNGDTIHIAQGTYINPIVVTLDGLKLVGEDPNNKPVITRISGGINQALLVIHGAKNVSVQNLHFSMDQTFIAEGIIANGFVDGLNIANNDFVDSQSLSGTSSKYSWRNAISINDDNGNSQGLGTATGSNVTVSGNTINGTANLGGGVFLRSGVDMDNGVGTINGNTITTGVQDIHVRFSTTTTASSGTTTLIDNNTLNGRGLEFDAPNASAGAIAISNNHINAPSFASGCTAADCSLVRLIDNQQNISTTLSGNTFVGHAGSYRGVLIENYPGVNLTNNIFMPASGATNFVSLVVSNKELTSGTAIAPYSMTLTATGNTFNGSGIANAGTAVEFLDDNDANGTATFGSVMFGGAGAGQANSFDANLRWYFHLDDYNCNTVTASGSTPVCTAPPLPDYADDIGTNPATNTQVRPFTGNVSAANNTFAGAAPSAATANALFARTYDKGANPVLGTVDYGLTQTEPVVYVDGSFAGANYGDSETFPFANPNGACAVATAYFGVNAFATISDGLMHVTNVGTVCIAKGTYTEAVNVTNNVQLIGDGNTAADTVIAGAVSLNASGTSAVPLLLQNLRVTNTAGKGVAVAAASYLTFDGVAFAGNGDSGLDFGATSDTIVISNSVFDSNVGAGLRTASTAQVSNVNITSSTFSNNAAGIILFGASGSGNGQISNWMIDTSQFLSNDNANASAFGGGIWLKTGGAGSAINGFAVTGSTFADNGSSNTLNQVGITVRARPGTTMTGVNICNNTFSETATLGTQLTGINVFDDTGNTGYQPITVCSSNTFTGLGHSVSGLEQHTLRGTQPVVYVTGGSLANTEYINAPVTRVRDNVLFPTITQAMNDVGTTTGDTILLGSGVYSENVTVTHDGMTLTGAGTTTSVIDGGNAATPGITLPNGRVGTTISNLAVQNVHNSCIYGSAGNNNTTVDGTLLSNCRADLGSVNGGGIYMNGPVDTVTFNNNEVTASAARGIVIWNGFKTHITITNNNVHDLVGCCGIELQDGTASGVTVTGNTVANTGDSGMAFIQLTSGAGANLIANNTISNTGRFGMEIKIPNGTGAASGDGSIVVSGNTVTAGASAANLDDRAGIAVIRRGYCSTCGETDITTGVIVSGNTIGSWQPSTGSPNQGFGIVVEGTNSQVSGNTLNGNQIGVQFQAGNAGYPGDSNQAASDAFFSRGDAPNTCALLGSNTDASNGTDFLTVTNPPGLPIQALVHNTTRGTNFCTIQSAIDDAATQNGDTIAVDPGSFAENVSVTKGVTLQGPKHGIAGSDASRDGTGEAILSPATGIALKVLANNVTFDGFTIQNVADTAIASGGNYGGESDTVSIINNRVLNVTTGSGLYTNGPRNTPVTNWTVSNNLFSNIQPLTGNPPVGSGINLWAVTGGTISNNVVTNSAFGGIQVNGGTSVTITGNTISQTAHNGINIAQSTGVQVSGNIVTDANTSGTVDEAGMTLYGGTSNAVFSCNSVSGSGTNGFSTDHAITDPFSGISVFDNAIEVGSDISHNLSQSIIIGSNYYGGSTPTVNGSNAAGVQVATALSASPIGNAACGDNTAVGIVAVSGAPQTTQINTPFASPLNARVVDALGGSVAGASITFAAPPSGASAALAPASGTSDFDGSISATATANAIAGSYAVTATSGSNSASFALTNAGQPSVALTLNGPASTTTGTATPGYTAQLSNTGAATSENVLVDFVLSRPGGLAAGDATLQYNTGSGYATIPLTACGSNLCGSFGPPTTGFPLAAGYNATTQLQFTSHKSGAVTLTASVDGVTSHTAYASSSMTVTVTAVATTIAANGAITFVGNAGDPLAGALPSVRITDANGNPAAGVSITFAAAVNSGTLTGATQVTDSNGIATLGGWTLNSAPGTNTVTASATGLSGSPVTFTASTPNVALTLSGPAQALVTTAPYTDFVEYDGSIGNSGATTPQKVHYEIAVVRIDDNNAATPGQPMTIALDDVQVCVNDPSGAQSDNKGCPNNAPESLFYSETAGSLNGRSADLFRYPINPLNDNALPTLPVTALPPSLLRFKYGDYQVNASLVGDDDGTVYATSVSETTVPNAAISYNGATSGQAEDALLSTTTLTNTGGRVALGNVIVRITLSDTGGAALTPADAELDYQLGSSYQALPWTQSGVNLVTFFGPANGFPLADGHNATTAGRGIFHREGSYTLLYEVLDATNLTPLYASATVTPITIGANQVNFTLSDLQQVFNGTPRAVTVGANPNTATYAVLYEALTGSSCPASADGGATATAPTNAGSYCVYVNATGTYQGSASGTLTIAKAQATVSIDGAVSGTVNRTFNNAPQVVTGTATATPAPTGTVSLTYNGDPNAPTAAGSYGLVATLTDPNYTGSATGNLVIATPAGVTITLDAPTETATYDGNSHAVTATTNPAGIAYTVTYVGSGSTVYPLTTTAPTAAGMYNVVATTADANYANPAVSASGTLTISPATATLSIAAVSVTYNGQPQGVAVTATPSNLAFSVSYSGNGYGPSSTPPTNVGSYTATATSTDPNYTGSGTGMLTINPKAGQVNFGATNFTYDGTAHSTTAVISEEPGDTVACTLSATSGAYPITHAGTTSLTADCVGTNYTATGSTTLIVSPASVTLALSGTGSFVYSGSADVATASVSGAISPDAPTAVVSYNPGGVNAPITVGVYNVVATLDPSVTDYTAAPANGLIQITPAAATVTISNTTQTFDGNPKPVTVTTTPSGLTTSVTYADSGTAPSAVGSYTVVATVTDPNYTGSASATLQIVAANLPDVGVTISDGRQYVQYGKSLTYTIAVNNVGNTVIGSGTVADTLPPELDASTATAQCFVAGAATCTASIDTTTGVLTGSVSNVPVNGGVTFVVTAAVSTAPNLPSEQVVNQVTVGTTGDTNNANDSATSTTQIVIFRDGFEAGGDGAQATASAAHVVGALNRSGLFVLDPAQAPASGSTPTTWTRATDAHGRDVFRIESLRVPGNVLVQIVTSAANGHEAHTPWMPLGKQTAGLALSDTNNARSVILVGADNGSLQAAIASQASQPLTMYTAQ